MHEPGCPGCKRGCRLGRFGQHRVARSQRSGDLPGEDGQREVPRADANVRPARCRVFGQRLGPGRVVAQEIHGFPKLGDGIGQGLACLCRQQGKGLIEVLLIEVCDPVKRRCTFGGSGGPGLGSGQRAVDLGSRCGANLPDGSTRCRVVDRGAQRCGRVLFPFRHCLRCEQRFNPQPVWLPSPGIDVGQRGHIRQIPAVGVGAFGLEQVRGQRDRRRLPALEPCEPVKGAGDDIFWGDAFVDDLVDEGRVCPVLQQPAHQIGQQFAVRANRCVDAASHPLAGHQMAVERLSHAVEALKLVVVGSGLCGHFEDGGDRVGVVGRKLGVEAVGHAEQLSRQGDVTDIRGRLLGEDGIAVEAFDLSVLDFGVPVGALDQPHHQPPIERVGHGIEPVDHLSCAAAVALYHHPETVPAAQ